MSHPHEWDDPRQQDAYARLHRYDSFPQGCVDGVDPGRYATQAAYYEAQREAYISQQHFMANLTLGLYAAAEGAGPIRYVDDEEKVLYAAATSEVNSVLRDMKALAKYRPCNRERAELRGAIVDLEEAIEDVKASDDSDFGKAWDLQRLARKYWDKIFEIQQRWEDRVEKEEHPPSREPEPQGHWQRFKQWLYE